MSKWTPGPWATDETEHEVPYQAIRILGKNRGICSIWMDDAPVHDFNAEQRANARLIAAAPELVEALEVITKRMEQDYTEVPCADQSVGAALPPELYTARALLARINGESQ